MAIPDVLVSVNGLSISFGMPHPVFAVCNLSFDLFRGKTLAIVGESGSGKTLTALALAGLLPKNAHQEGSIRVSPAPGKDLAPLSPSLIDSMRGTGMGFVFQEPMSALNPLMRVGSQVREAIKVHHHISTEEATQQALSWLEKVALPDPGKLYDRFPHQLSGGQKQRVMIAIAMANAPALLIADEPTTALDPTLRLELLKLINGLVKGSGTAVMLVTHNLDEARAVADDVLVMRKGLTIDYGPTEQVLGQPGQNYTRALLACRPAPESKGQPLPDLEMIMAGMDQKTNVKNELEATRVVAGPGRAPALEVRDLNVWYPQHKGLIGQGAGPVKAVCEVSFSLQQGETLGLAGESGSGKSTLCGALVGLIPIVSGAISIAGSIVALRKAPDWKTVRRKMQIVFQDPYASLNPRMTIGDQLTEPLQTHRIVPARRMEQEVFRLLDLVRLPASASAKYPHEFSGGQRQRIVIARALAVRPEILLADECVASLDVSIQAQILNLLQELQKVLGLSILFISHDLATVHYISDRIMVMKNGRIVETGTADQVLHNPADPYTRKMAEASALIIK